MAQSGGNEADKWKSKYYEVLDRFDKKETEWTKSEKLLNKALGRISILAEGDSPLVDHHLQALRTVLKEKFSFYRVEAVLSELFKIITEVDKNKTGKAEKVIELSVLTEILSVIDLEKPEKKKLTQVIKQLNKQPELAVNMIADIKQIITSAKATKAEKSSGLISKLFKKESVDKSEKTLLLLSDVIAALPWPQQRLNDKVALVKAIKVCNDEKVFADLLLQLKRNIAEWPANEKDLDASAVNLIEESTDEESIKQKCLNQFVNSLKEQVSNDEVLQSINLASTSSDQLISELSALISRLISSKGNEKKVEPEAESEGLQLRELFIQLVEQLVVPIGLMEKADELKVSLEEELSTDWRRALKKVVHFINEVRFHEYQQDDNYEDFLQQVTDRLQEMVQFIESENRRAVENGERGSSINQAMVDEVAGLKKGVETAGSLQELQTVVNHRLDAISEFVKQHGVLEEQRLENSASNVGEMQQKIQLLEKETAELKVSLEKKNREAMYDALTGIPNRLFFDKRVQEDIGRWKRFDTPLSLAIWDVDKFKSVNDTYGHKAGDKVLKAIAQILNKRIRETDFLARYGGEEFAMLLPGTVEEETLRLANELRQSVQQCAFHYNDESVEITISCGISGFRQGDELHAVFERADKALYQAKDSGRNRCVIAACNSR